MANCSPMKRARSEQEPAEDISSISTTTINFQIDESSNNKRQKTTSSSYEDILLSILEDDQETPQQEQQQDHHHHYHDISSLINTLQQDLIPSFPPPDSSISTTTSNSSSDIDEPESVMRHLLEASDDELGIPSSSTSRSSATQSESEEEDHDYARGETLLMFQNYDIIQIDHEEKDDGSWCWEIEDEAANYYTLLQSHLLSSII